MHVGGHRPVLRPEGPFRGHAVRPQSLLHDRGPVNRMAESAANLGGQLSRCRVEDDDVLKRTRDHEEGRGFGILHRIHRVWTHLVQHVDTLAQQVCPGGPHVGIVLNADSVDQGTPEIVGLVRLHVGRRTPHD